VPLEHLDDLDYVPEAAPSSPCVPPFEELFSTRRIHMTPEPAELLLDCPGSGGLQAVLPDGREPASLCWREIGVVEEPELPCPLEPIIVFGLEGLVLGSPHLIDGFSEVLGDMELVVHQLRVRGLVRDRVGIGREHVGSHGHNLLPLLNRQRLQDRLCFPAHGGTIVFTPCSAQRLRGSRATSSVVNCIVSRCRQRRSSA